MGRTRFRVACATLLLGGFGVTSTFSQSLIDRIPHTGTTMVLRTRVMSPSGRLVAGEATPNLAGTYQCGPDAKACQWLGTTITLTQSGTKLEIRTEKGDTGYGEITSHVSLAAGPPFNMFGVITDEGRSLEWSNGTKW